MTWRTPAVEDVWYSLSAALIPPDDSPDWLDLHRHQAEAVIVLGRFRGTAAAIAWAWRHHGIDPALWYQADEPD